jgi:hypothetical protein
VIKYLIDTNVLSELRRATPANARLHEWAASVDPLDSAVSVISLMELEYGAKSVRSKDPAFAARLTNWIANTIRPTYEGRLLAVDEIVASRCATLIASRSQHLSDALIAATALAHRLTVITRNVRHFEPMGVPILNPWTA